MAKNVELKKVKLKKSHTHRGVEYEKGETIKVTPEQSTWLKSLGVV